MIAASCHCGACVIVVQDAPATVTSCNCSICRRYGVLWAYYPKGAVDLSQMGETDTYMWDDRVIAFHRCRTCGCVTHWLPVDPTGDRLGINARLFSPDVLVAARVRHLDGADTEQYID